MGNKRKPSRLSIKLKRKQQAHQKHDTADFRNDWGSCPADVNELAQPSELINEVYLPDDQDFETAELKSYIEEQDNLHTDVLCENDEELKPDLTNLDGDDFEEKYDPVSNISEEWVIEQQLCRCCHAEGDNFLSLQDTDQLEGVSYEDMLATCSGVLPLRVAAGALRALCVPCAARLRAAHALGRRARACEERFRALYNDNLLRVADDRHSDLGIDDIEGATSKGRYSAKAPPIIKVPCEHHSTAYNCTTLSKEDIIKFHTAFYKHTTKISQDNFILKYSKASPVQRRRPKTGTGNGKVMSIVYYARRKTNLVPVCLKTFLSILGLRKGRVTGVITRNFNTGLSASEGRGGDRNIRKLRVKDVIK